MVTHQLQVERRTGKVRRPETDVLPLCHATNPPNVANEFIWRQFPRDQQLSECVVTGLCSNLVIHLRSSGDQRRRNNSDVEIIDSADADAITLSSSSAAATDLTTSLYDICHPQTSAPWTRTPCLKLPSAPGRNPSPNLS